jgi:pimeloyl-ACP methyl ester carboxylesterase
MGYRQDIRRAYERISAGSELAATSCGAIEYAVAGAGVPLLSIHGAGGGFDQGLDLAEPLVNDGFRIIAVSRFGYLRTPLPADASAAAQADAHACLLDALGVERAAILGTSAGGPSALQFALRHPDRTAALALLVPAAYAPRPNAAPAVRTPRGTLLLFDTALRSDFLFWAMRRIAHDAFVRRRSPLAQPTVCTELSSPRVTSRKTCPEAVSSAIRAAATCSSAMPRTRTSTSRRSSRNQRGRERTELRDRLRVAIASTLGAKVRVS